MNTKNKQRILFAVPLPNPIHGSSLVSLYIKNSDVIRKNFDCKFVNISTSRKSSEIGKNPVSKIFRFILILIKILVFILRFRPKFFYIAPTASGAGFYKDFFIIMIAKIFKLKTILHFHSKGVATASFRKLDYRMYKLIFHQSKVILLSERLVSDLAKFVRDEDIFICPNGIPYISNRHVREEISEVPKILFLSNLIETKGVWKLLEALKILSESGQKFTCDIVGAEGDISAEQLEERIIAEGLSNIVAYLGAMVGRKKNEIFCRADIFAFPSFYEKECFPLVLLEAMSFSLPIVATNEGGIEDIVDNGVNGLIVEKSNSIDLSEKLQSLIENPNNAKRMGSEGFDLFQKKFTLCVFEKRLCKILSNIVRGGSSHDRGK